MQRNNMVSLLRNAFGLNEFLKVVLIFTQAHVHVHRHTHTNLHLLAKIMSCVKSVLLSHPAAITTIPGESLRPAGESPHTHTHTELETTDLHHTIFMIHVF